MPLNEKTSINKVKAAFVVFLIVVLLFTSMACKNKRPEQSGNIPEGTTKEELHLEGTVYFVYNNESNTSAEGMAPNAVARAFMEAYPNTNVIVEADNRGNYATRISAGDMGDVFWCDENDAHNFQRTHKALMPLDAYLKPLNIDIADIYVGALVAGQINGRLYMAPRKLGQQVLIYNADAVSEAGLSVPSDRALEWDEFKDICRQLTIDDDGDGVYNQVGAAFKIWWSPVWLAFFSGFGGKWIDNEVKQVYLTSDENVLKGAEEMINACVEGWMYPEDATYSGEKGKRYTGLSQLDYVFRTFGAFTWLSRYGMAYDNAEIAWDFTYFPKLPVHSVGAGSTGYVVYNRTTNPDAAACFALFFLTEDGQRAYHSQTGGSTPLLISLSQETFWRGRGTDWEDKNYDVFISYPKASIPATVITQAPLEIAQIFSDSNMRTMFESILSGRTDLQTQFAKMETQANELWSTLIL